MHYLVFIVFSICSGILKFCVYRQIPSVLEYLGYNFCFLCFLAGPACTYKEYQDFITGSNFTSAKLENPNQFALVSGRQLSNVMKFFAVFNNRAKNTLKNLQIWYIT